MYKFSDYLRNAMKENGLTQKELAIQIGTTQATISRWLKGVYEPEVTSLLNICKVLNETPNSLLGINDEINDYNSNRGLSDDQQYILKEYNKLSSLDKQKIVNYMAVCSTKAEKKSDNSLTPMEEEVIKLSRQLKDRSDIAEVIGFLHELNNKTDNPYNPNEDTISDDTSTRYRA